MINHQTDGGRNTASEQRRAVVLCPFRRISIRLGPDAVVDAAIREVYTRAIGLRRRHRLWQLHRLSLPALLQRVLAGPPREQSSDAFSKELGGLRRIHRFGKRPMLIA